MFLTCLIVQVGGTLVAIDTNNGRIADYAWAETLCDTTSGEKVCSFLYGGALESVDNSCHLSRATVQQTRTAINWQLAPEAAV